MVCGQSFLSAVAAESPDISQQDDFRDEDRRGLDENQKLTDTYQGKLDAIAKTKEKELLEFK